MNWQLRIKDWWFQKERYIFWVIVLVNLIPVLGVHYFFTGDGPSHLYNSKIIASLLNDADSPFASFYNLRLELIPNLGGHALLTLFNSLLPAFLAEKGVYLLYLILFPLSFRYAIQKFNSRINPLFYFIFILAHNFCFYIGFQSFLLGLVMAFFSLGLAQDIYRQNKPKRVVWWGLLIFITAVFHLFAAFVALLATGALFLFQAISSKYLRLKMTAFFLLASVPTLAFCLNFLARNKEGLFITDKTILESLNSFYATAAIVLLDNTDSLSWILISVIILVSTFFVLLKRILNKEGLRPSDSAFFTSLLCLILYFILPDKMASGGFISIRFLLCFLLFWAFWVAIVSEFSIVNLVLGVLIIGLNAFQVQRQFERAKELDEDARNVMEVLPFLEEGSTLLPLNYSDNWLHYNIGLYPGGAKKLVVLDNYEASTNHFPVMWNERIYSNQSLGDYAFSNRPTLYIRRYEESTGIKVDAVLRWRHNYEMKDAATLHTDSVLSLYFNPVYNSNDGEVELHLRK